MTPDYPTGTVFQHPVTLATMTRTAHDPGPRAWFYLDLSEGGRYNGGQILADADDAGTSFAEMRRS